MKKDLKDLKELKCTFDYDLKYIFAPLNYTIMDIYYKSKHDRLKNEYSRRFEPCMKSHQNDKYMWFELHEDWVIRYKK